MYKKQIKPTKTSGSVIKLKKKTKDSNSAKSVESVGIKQKNESAETSKDNEKLSHFHKDVPEHVQEFISPCPTLTCRPIPTCPRIPLIRLNIQILQRINRAVGTILISVSEMFCNILD